MHQPRNSQQLLITSSSTAGSELERYWAVSLTVLSRFYGRKILFEIKKKRVGIWDHAEVATKRLRNASNYIRKKCVGSSYAFGNTLPRDVTLGPKRGVLVILGVLHEIVPTRVFRSGINLYIQSTYSFKKLVPDQYLHIETRTVGSLSKSRRWSRLHQFYARTTSDILEVDVRREQEFCTRLDSILLQSSSTRLIKYLQQYYATVV